MEIPKKAEKGFTLIELLIVVAILGVLAAVVIPNVGKFIGRGESEAGATEFANIQSAVISMMTDQGQSDLSNPRVTNPGDATNDMNDFPEFNSDNDSANYVLFAYNGTDNYLVTRFTKGTYVVDANGTVTQVTDGYGGP